ncbi:sensor histidine kinase [Arthrobacter bambusae]
MSEAIVQPVGILRPRARLVHTLGSDLISNERIALIELVKNSYDADASHVVIEFSGSFENGEGSIAVWDNGHGMSLETVKNVWSEIATPFRRETHFSESAQRRVLGEKGIGRLAASRIGTLTEIVTARADFDEVVVLVDWDQFQQDIYLDEVEFSITERSPLAFGPNGKAVDILGPHFNGHGVGVQMTRLTRSWDEEEIRQLRLSLSRLAEPLPAGDLEDEVVQDFAISLSLPDRLSHLAGSIAPSDAVSHPHYSISGSVDPEGRAELTYKELLSGESSEVTTEISMASIDGTERRTPMCGPIKVDIRAWDLDKDAFEATKGQINMSAGNLKDYRAEIKEHSGVALFRDRFRVQPFGDATFDWLNLDARRVNNPTTRLSNNQISGFVFIKADENPELKDRSHREGLIDTQEYEDLQKVILSVIQELEVRRRKSRKARNAGSKVTKGASSGGLFQGFSLSKLEALSISRAHDAELQQAVKETQVSVETGIRNVKATLSRFSRLATLGSVVDIVLHEGRGAVARIKAGAFQLEGAVKLSQDEVVAARTRRNAPRISAGAEILTSLFRRIEPLSGRRRGRPSKVELKAIVDGACDLLVPEFERLNIRLSKRVAASSVTVDEGEIIQVLVNLLDNATYWLTHVEKDQRQIIVDADRDSDGHVVISVSDSGPGVPEDLRDDIFDPYFSTKPNGTGLGLAIAGSTVLDFYDGSLALVESEELPGATFQMTLRKRVGG